MISCREYLRHPGAAAIIPMFDDGRVILEKQYRHPLRKTFLEIPAGKLDPRESPLNCAKRELIEETGYEASKWKLLGQRDRIL
ncbi:NUDIX hydrolase [uncultured Parasutterella sp.]|uniref:NUDIX domain-containing protein n=1 Tax=uncultured Parasutterella sp. TaxID=1263098 RepID=UPI0025B5305F|nr:NUDIX hydrolase [uncultured Parasutterella sp.]